MTSGRSEETRLSPVLGHICGQCSLGVASYLCRATGAHQEVYGDDPGTRLLLGSGSCHVPGELDLGIIAKLRLSALSPPELGPVNELPLLGPCLPASVEI